MKNIILSIVTLSIIQISVNAQVITTIAGTGTYGYSGDGGPAIHALVSDMYYCYPASDHAGNIYFAQLSSNTIRKIDKNGIITTIAGTEGVIGYSGDGGPAVNALFYHPSALAIDASNNIYVSDRNGAIIRKIDAAGIVTTISGQQSQICGSGDGGPLINAQFAAISGISIDKSDNLYISDFGCNSVRKVNKNGIITTIAGGSYGFGGDGGKATAAKLAYPCTVGIDSIGNVYIPDAQNHRIRKIDVAGNINTIAGTGVQGYSGDGGSAKNADIAFPGSVVIDKGGNVYFGDNDNVIRKINPSGIISTYAGTGHYGYSGDGGAAILADISMTQGRISIDDNDNIFFCGEAPYYAVRKISNCATAVINQQPTSVTVCNNANASFSVDPNNTYTYQWEVNSGSGWSSISNGVLYSGSNTNKLSITGATVAQNGFQYRCMIQNNCAFVFSLPALLNVNSSTQPTIQIVPDLDTVCEGTTIKYTATIFNSGTGPSSYQWQKNGVPVGSNANTYSDNFIANTDTITCVYKFNNACMPATSSKSNSLTVKVISKVSPSISISSSANNICYGVPVTFTASSINGGTDAHYQWKKNGLDAGTNSTSYLDSILNNGDIISCTLTSSIGCVTQPTVNSNPIIMTVNALLIPSIKISASDSNVCEKTLVVFHAVSYNGGASPIYNWRKNNAVVGFNTDSYSDNNLSNGDLITCQITSNASCIANATALSNIINMTVWNAPKVMLDHSNTVCMGSDRTLDAGNFASYMWSDGSVERYLVIKKAGIYFVNVKDNNGCDGRDTVIINKELPQPMSFLPPDTSVCSYGSISIKAKYSYRKYLWNTNSIGNTIMISQPGVYWLEVTDFNDCIGRDSIVVKRKDCISGFYIPNGFSPNKDGRNDYFKPLLFGNVKSFHFVIYNRWGQVIFETNDYHVGWDGNIKGNPADPNVYLWICSYQLENENAKIERGNVTIVR